MEVEVLLLQAVRIRAPITRMRAGTQVRSHHRDEGGPREVPITGMRAGIQGGSHHRDRGYPGEVPITGMRGDPGRFPSQG